MSEEISGQVSVGMGRGISGTRDPAEKRSRRSKHEGEGRIISPLRAYNPVCPRRSVLHETRVEYISPINSPES